MNILVTGGAGYIGSHACKALAQAGYTPVSFDNLVYGHRQATLDTADDPQPPLQARHPTLSQDVEP